MSGVGGRAGLAVLVSFGEVAGEGEVRLQAEESFQRNREAAAVNAVEDAAPDLRTPLAVVDAYYAALVAGDVAAYRALIDERVFVAYIDDESVSEGVDPTWLPGSQIREKPEDHTLLAFFTLTGDSEDDLKVVFVYSYQEGEGERKGEERAECHEVDMVRGEGGWRIIEVNFYGMQPAAKMALERRRAEGREIEGVDARFRTPLAVFEEYQAALLESDPERELECFTDGAIARYYAESRASILPDDVEGLREMREWEQRRDFVLLGFEYYDDPRRPRIRYTSTQLQRLVDSGEEDDTEYRVGGRWWLILARTPEGWKIDVLEE
jgi:hypothetical protein